MDDIIQKIIDFEKKAQSVMSSAREQQYTYEDTIRREIEAFRETVVSENAARLEGFKARMEKEAEEGVRRVEEIYGEKIAEMRKTADSMKHDWAGRLYDMVVSGEIR